MVLPGSTARRDKSQSDASGNSCNSGFVFDSRRHARGSSIQLSIKEQSRPFVLVSRSTRETNRNSKSLTGPRELWKFLIMRVAVLKSKNVFQDRIFRLLQTIYNDIATIEFSTSQSSRDLILPLVAIDALVYVSDIQTKKQSAEQVKGNLSPLLIGLCKTLGIPKLIYISQLSGVDLNIRQNYFVENNNLDIAIISIAPLRGERRWGRRIGDVIESFGPILEPGTLLAALKSEIERPIESEIHEQFLSEGQNGNWFYCLAKRSVDLFVAVFFAVFFCWLLALVWLVVRLQSPGPGFFAQQRVGQGEKEFTCYKFRTMSTGTPELGTHQVGESAITKSGRFLRRTKIDELPQIWNVLRNEMSLVGPRPCLPSQSDVLLHRRNAGIFGVKPGITGLSQIRQIDMSKPGQLAKIDQEYVRLQSIKLDFAILIKTILGGGSGDKIKIGET